VSDRDELLALRRMAELEAKAAPAKRERKIPGDAGAALSAADAWGAINKLIEHLGYEGGGKVTDVASTVMSPEAASGLGYATNVGVQAIPALLGGQGLQKAVTPLMQSASKRMMQSAMKPPIKDILNGDAAKAVQTMLDEGASVTPGGVLKLRKQIETLGDEVKNAVASSTATIKKGDVGLRLQSTLDDFKNQVNPQADMEALRKAWLNFRNHPDLIGKQDIPVQTAHRLKQGTYRALGDKPYGELQGAQIESQKQLARALREEVAQAVPGVAEPLRRQSGLINAADLAERRVMAQSNNNLLGLAPLGVSPLSWLMFLADRNPATVSALARMTNANARTLPALLGQSAGALYSNQQLGTPALSVP
jgi:hypothetical protein